MTPITRTSLVSTALTAVLAIAAAFSNGCAGCVPGQGNGGDSANENANQSGTGPNGGNANGTASGSNTNSAGGTSGGSDPGSSTPTGGSTNPGDQLPHDIPPSGTFAPVAFSQTIAVPYETAVIITLAATDSDTAQDALEFSVGASVRSGRIDATARNQVTYVPNLGFSGEDSFNFTASDGPNRSAAATVSLQVAQRPAGADPTVHTWRNLGPGLTSSTPAFVAALKGFQQQVVAGGIFSNAGGAPATNVAAFQSELWSALGSNLNAEVRALEVFNGQLLAGVSPTLSGAGALEAWDGAGWAPFGGSLGWSGTIHSIAVFQGQLWVVGDFTRVSGQDLSRIARWDGATFVPVGTGLRTAPTAGAPFAAGLALLATPQQLFVAGSFDRVSGVSAKNIAVWNGQAWSALGAGTDGLVFALASYQGHAIAGGSFRNAGGIPAAGIARWNGAAWESMGSGININNGDFVRALAADGTRLYVGGQFAAISGAAAANVARWDGLEWRGLGTGIASTRSVAGFVQALLVDGPDLVAGGQFDRAGGAPAEGIARWRIAP